MKSAACGAREMVRQLKACAALAEDLSMVPVLLLQVLITNTCNSSSRRCCALICPPQAPAQPPPHTQTVDATSGEIHSRQ